MTIRFFTIIRKIDYDELHPLHYNNVKRYSNNNSEKQYHYFATVDRRARETDDKLP